MVKPWDNLLKIALLGTERHPLMLANEGDALSAILAQFKADERETTLLQAAGTVALYQRAGRLPSAVSAFVAACELNDLPVINQRAALRLQMMLKDTRYQPLLPEWLKAVAQRGLRLPDVTLPKVLQLGADKTELRELLLPVLGARGRWLAAQHPAGQWVAGDTVDETIWHDGTREQRLAFLKRLRASDATKARELLQTCWVQEPPQERATFISVFITNLSLADEPFLESALDDKRKEVREQAVELLSRLPESAFAKRMIERARGLAQFNRKGKEAGQLEIKMPASCDQAMLRDGFEKAANQISSDTRHSWLKTLVAGIPPTAWKELLGESNFDWLGALPKGKTGNAFLESLGKAALRNPSDTLITSLLLILFARSVIVDLSELFEKLGPMAQERLANEWLSHPEVFDQKDERFSWLLSLNCSLSEALSRKFLSSLVSYLQTEKTKKNYWWQNYFGALPSHLSPSVYPFAEGLLSPYLQAEHQSSPALQNLLDVLQFRYEMLKEIAS